MNIEQMVNMFVRMVGQRLMSRGIDAGFNMFSSKGKSKDEMTQADRDASAQIKQTGKRAQQAARLGRRIGRL